MAERTNDRIDRAQVEAILAGGQEQVNRYLVTTLAVLITRSEAVGTETDEKIRRHRDNCRGQSRRTFYGFLVACGTCVGLLTPYILRWHG